EEHELQRRTQQALQLDMFLEREFVRLRKPMIGFYILVLFLPLHQLTIFHSRPCATECCRAKVSVTECCFQFVVLCESKSVSFIVNQRFIVIVYESVSRIGKVLSMCPFFCRSRILVAV